MVSCPLQSAWSIIPGDPPPPPLSICVHFSCRLQRSQRQDPGNSKLLKAGQERKNQKSDYKIEESEHREKTQNSLSRKPRGEISRRGQWPYYQVSRSQITRGLSWSWEKRMQQKTNTTAKCPVYVSAPSVQDCGHSLRNEDLLRAENSGQTRPPWP